MDNKALTFKLADLLSWFDCNQFSVDVWSIKRNPKELHGCSQNMQLADAPLYKSSKQITL